ncbi:protein GLUTAMINE DUMPER 2-like [Pyrus communis]|uniref:protein GLUTAMINE DUMPER 2-like n=1 Tax=Pyrus communis TaxID=23211 RepID=UPI0035BEB9EC
MSPATTSAISATTKVHNLWRSPLPYLFGGLGLMLLLISVALVILACSYRKPSSSEDDEEKPAKPMSTVLGDERRIAIVIMAGDDMPTHLATEVITPTTHHCTCSSETDQKV